MNTINNSRFLHHVLLADALSCAATGLLLSLAAAPLATLLGLPADLLFYAGLSLLPFAALLTWLSTQARIKRPQLLAVTAINGLWVLASIALLLLPAITPTALGYGFVIAQAGAVLLLMELQILGIKKAATEAA